MAEIKTIDTEKERVRFLVSKFAAVELPIFEEKRNVDWVNAGKNNNYFNELLDLSRTANKHGSLLESKAQYISGKGFKGFGKEIANTDNETFDDVLGRSAQDFELYNGFALEIVWNADFTAPADLRHVDFTKVRMNPDESEYYYADHWVNSVGNQMPISKIKEEDNGWTIYQPFNPDKAKADKVQLVYYKHYKPGVDYYPLPVYIGAMQYIVAERKVSRYHVNNLDNNFWNNIVINWRDGEPTAPEKKSLVNRFTAQQTSSEEGGKVMHTFTDPGVEPPDITQLTSNESADVFTYLSTLIQEEIFIGHQITSPILFGVKTEGQLGGRTEMLEAAELFQNKYVEPRQEEIERVFNNILGIEDAEILPLRTVKRQSILENEKMIPYLTRAEIRAMIADEYGVEIAEEVEVIEPTEEVKENPLDEGNKTEELQLSADALEEFRALGTDAVEGFELLCQVDNAPMELREYLESVIDTENVSFNLASSGKASPKTKSKQDKNGFAVRYRYSGNATPERAFCRTMMSDNKLYRSEDIKNMRNRPVNPGFGKDGTNTYSIWNYQGGGLLSETFPKGTCKHFWAMEVYVSKAIGDSSRVALGKQISTAVAIRNGISPLQNPASVHTPNNPNK